MKRKILFSVFGGFLIVGITLLTSCNKEFPRRMSVVTLPVDSLLAMARGQIIDMGESGISQHGFVYDSTALISANAQRIQLGSASNTGLYEALLTNLRPHTRYYINSFLISGDQITYGDVVVYFVTAMNLPEVKTDSLTDITDSTATCSGDIIQDGGAQVNARGICWSKLTQPTLLNDHSVDGSGTGKFTGGLIHLEKNATYFVRAYASNNAGTSYGNELSFTTLSDCGSITINHFASGGVAPVDKTVTYGTVTNIPGEPSKCWITSNLGADHQATAKDDASEASAGWYWQFNHKQGYKHDGSIRTPNTTWISSIIENLDWQTSNDPCSIELGSGWRIPTYTEWFNVDASGGWSNRSGPWNSGLKLHAAGYLNYGNGSLVSRGSEGYFWSSVKASADYGWNLNFNSESSLMYLSKKAGGFTLRCIKDQ